MVLSGLVHGDNNIRKKILGLVTPNYFWPKSFTKYLFEMMSEQIEKNRKINYQDIISRIPDHSREIWGEEPNERVLKGDYSTLSQIIHYNPTYAQVEKAIELIKIYAIEKGWIKI